MTSDPRPLLGRALDQTSRLLHHVRPEQLTGPTPCTEFDVLALSGHLVKVVRRIAWVGTGGVAVESPGTDDVTGENVAALFDAGRKEVDAAWAGDAVLDQLMVMPFGTFPGRLTGFAYVQELTTHGWDLAVSTGQRDVLDDELAVAVMDTAHTLVPAEPRGGPVPFGPVVPVGADAGTYEQLVGWLGRDPSF